MYGYNIFHEALMKNLIGSVHSGLISHAYIFEGDAGLNLIEAARLFAAALTCENQSVSPCMSCRICAESKAETNPDIIFFKKPRDKRTIGVDPIRELLADTQIRPFAAAHKVYIIEEGDLLTPQAQNALLKTLEEPPSYIVFIIITTNRSVMLDTVLSRATAIYFPPVKDAVIEKYIEEKYPEAENKDLILKFSEGIPGAVDAIMDDESFYVTRNETLSKLPLLLTKDKKKAFEIKKYLTDNSDFADRILDLWISFVRDILVIQTGAAQMVINHDKREELGTLAIKLDPKITVSALDELFSAKEMLRRNVSLKSVAIRLPLQINR